MSRAANGARQPGGGMQGAGMFFLALAIFAIVGAFWVAMTLGSKLAGVNTDLPLDPFAVIGGTIKGRYTWSAASTGVAIAIAAVLIVLVVLYLVQGARARAKRTEVDWAAAYMGRGKNLTALSEKGAAATAQRLGVTGWIGSPIGVTVLGLRKLYASVEDMLVMIAGPRVGKSTSIVIPAIVGAPGAVMTTSNKRDVLDATRDVRAKAGQVWVFDPQGIALEEPTWWWNPLSYVVDDETAAKMAAHFGRPSPAVQPVTAPTGRRPARTSCPASCSPQRSTTARSPTCSRGSPAPGTPSRSTSSTGLVTSPQPTLSRRR